MTEPTQTPEAEPQDGQVPDDEPSLDTQVVERDGKRLVPETVVREQREKRRAAEEQVRILSEKAKKAESLETYYAQTQPLLTALKDHPDLQEEFKQRLDPNYKPTPKDSPPVDDQLVTLAKTLDLYDVSGRPDLARAEQVRALMRAETKSVVDESVTPVQQSQVADKAQQHYQWLLGFRGDFEKPVDKTILDQFVSNMTQDELAHQDTPWRLYAMARGLEAVQSQRTRVPPPETEPVFTERSGGAPVPTALSDRQKALAKELGRSEQDVLKDLISATENDGVIEA